MVQGGLVKGLASPGTRVYFAGEPVRVSADGDFLIGFHRDEPAEVNLKLIYPDGEVEQRNLKITKRNIDFFDMLVDVEVKDVTQLSNIMAILRGSPLVSSVRRARS